MGVLRTLLNCFPPSFLFVIRCIQCWSTTAIYSDRQGQIKIINAAIKNNYVLKCLFILANICQVGKQLMLTNIIYFRSANN